MNTMSSFSDRHLLLSLLLFLFLGVLPAQTQDDDDGCRGSFLTGVGGDSVVCVCGALRCPPLLSPGASNPPPAGHASTFTSSKGGQRFREQLVKVEGPNSGSGSGGGSGEGVAPAAVVEVACTSPRQVMTGFGGSMTDAAALTMTSLTPSTLDALLRSYFSPEGLEYDLLRVPIGGSDFSVRPYTYGDQAEDPAAAVKGGTEYFELQKEDLEFKLPLLRRALAMSRRPLRIMGSPWAPPAWMKSNAKINESGDLLPEMWQPWTDYLIRFVKEYEAADIPIWALTTQNHAFDTGIIAWNSLSWTASDMREWIKTSFGPSFHAAGLGRVKVYIGDETREHIDDYSRQILHDPEAARYVSGLAVHWYADQSVGPEVLDHAHLLFPDKDILYTESCIVPHMDPVNVPVLLGSWARAERYAENIIQDVNHRVSGWVDWNLALDLNGGPNWIGNNVDAPVIINTDKDEFYMQPMFYVMGHFSKFVPAGSTFLPSWVREGPSDLLHTAAFVHPQGNIVLQLLNKDDVEVEVRVEWEGGTFLHTLLPPRSLQTLLLPWEGDTAHAKSKYSSQGQGDQKTCH